MIFKFQKKYEIVLIFIFLFLGSFDGVLVSSVVKYLTIAIENKDIKMIFYVGIISICAYMLVVTCNYLYNVLKNKFIRKTDIEIKKEAFKYYLFLEEENNKLKINNLTSFILNDIKLFETNYLTKFFDIFLYLSYSIVSFVYIIVIDYKLAFIFAFFSLIPSIVPYFFKNIMKKNSEIWTLENENYTSKLNEAFEGIQTIKNYVIEKIIINRVVNSNIKMEKSFERMNNTISLSNAFVGMISILCYIIPLCIGSYLVIGGTSTLANLIAVFLASDRIITPFKFVINIYNSMQTVKPIKDKLNVILEQSSSGEINNSYDEEIREILLENCSVVKNGNKIIENVTMNICKGDKILITGASGSGKSMLAKLIQGSYFQTEGEIYINNNIREKTNLKKYYKHFSYIPQEPFIFEDTLSFNITFGREKNNINKTLKRLELSNNDNLNLGSFLEKRGKNISGGQKQRIEVIRGVLNNPDILIADEITSGLNNVLADEVEKFLLEQKQILIMISHHINPNMIHNYNKFIIIENGKINKYSLNEFVESEYYIKNINKK